jgi:hypothetical protein
MKSCSVRVRVCWVRNRMTCASVHSIALRRFGGHILNWGCRSQSSGILDGIVRSIHAIRRLECSHIARPSPQAVILCSSVSFIVQFLQMSWFEPTIPASERPQTYALDRAATRIIFKLYLIKPRNAVMTSLTCRFVCISVGEVTPRQQGGGTCHGKPKFDEISSWNKGRSVALIKYGWKARLIVQP